MARDLSGGAGELGERRGGDRRGAGGEEDESLAHRKSPAVDGDTGETSGTRRLFHRAPTRARAESAPEARSEEHTSELQSLMRTSYAVFCLQTKKTTGHNHHHE